ncbi:AP-3 complex subunit mu, putative [Plasmodium chabaudi chabaudi]|uniref:AP-3 complex subunit mu, putative n=1 Tax=Plasmodium chabaudi chabaudi TaxID=31271 RepID=A0A4V0KB38_PLACU|nr:AP-3 complex subunit mu, putative [Plasmodium chabaudi chabaudi]VTZ70028.1 AP-3 complex subunit mu, putative [Plasmodium chabaudi chabaudi]|eukprot:XP_738069.2 adaptor complexes medium subunit family [Plasmodium chabaudi chabaudi]
MDGLFIYTGEGRLLIEHVFGNDIEINILESDIEDIIINKKKELNNYFIVLNNENNNNFMKKMYKNNFIYLIIKDDIYFVAVKRDENNPILIVEIIQEIIKNIKAYFNVNKLNENIFLHNYSVINFLINENLTQEGKPSLFVNGILKSLVKNDSSILNEALKLPSIPNNIYNMITSGSSSIINNSANSDYINSIGNNANNKTNFIGNNTNENNINYSYSNGLCINSTDSMHIYWRPSNVYYSTNEIYVDVIENVFCIMNKFNKIIHYSIQGDVIINCTISGIPVVKLFFNHKIDLKKCHLHFTVNWTKLFKKNKTTNEQNAIYFVPLNEEYTVMQYFEHASLINNNKIGSTKDDTSINRFHNSQDQLTDVLNLKTSSMDSIDFGKPENSPNDKIQNSNCDENRQNTKNNNIDNMDKGYSYRNDENSDKEDNNVLTSGEMSSENDERQNDGVMKNENIESRFLLDYNNERCRLPINVKGNVIYVPTENMYKMKINVILNNIKKKKNSNLLLNSYENILIKIPVHNIISSVNSNITIGKLNYNDKNNCIFWYIENVVGTNTTISANISLHIKNSNNIYKSNNTLDILNENHYKDELSANYPYSYSENSYNNDGQMIYSSLNFVAYASLKVNGISISGKKIEKIEILESKNLDIRKGCRYSTYFNNLEFRI